MMIKYSIYKKNRRDMKYIKDPINKNNTAYDYFTKKSGMKISPESDLKTIRESYRETLVNHPAEFKDAGDMLPICDTVGKRLKMDFFYYLKDWGGKDG